MDTFLLLESSTSSSS